MFYSLFNLLLCSQLVLGGALRRAVPVPPSQDPFYTPPAGFESARPGTILRSRPAPAPIQALSAFSVNLKEVVQLLYRTNNAMGQPEATVTTVLVPYNATYDKLLSYQVAEDSGAQINCAPSYVLQTGSQALYAGTGDVEILLILAALNEGWIVNTPDWEGPNSTFIEGIQAGQATLDSIRASLSSGSITNVSSSAKVAMWGYSGGALASEWASELQASYAPEIPFVGMAIGGVTPNVTNVYNTINNGPFAGISASALLGFANAFPAFNTALQSHLIPARKAQFYTASATCFYGDVVAFALQDINSYFIDGSAVLQDPVIANYFKTNAFMGTHGVPSMPLFVYKAVGDEISPIADTDALVAKFCADGVPITYVRDAAGEHFSQAATSLPDVINFLRDRFNGVPVPAGCTTRNEFLDILDPGALPTFDAIVVEELLEILGAPVGPTHF